MNVLPSRPQTVRVIRKGGEIITLPLIQQAELEAAHDEGYQRGRQDAERITAGLSPSSALYNPYATP